MPFTYLWSNGQTTQSLQNVAAGNYTLTVTDTTNCSTAYNYTISQPALVTSSAISVDDTDPNPVIGNGSITLNVTGGNAPYTYSWTGPAGFSNTSRDIVNLIYGTYTVVITDANGCTATLSRSIYEPENCSDGIDNDNDGNTDCSDSDCKPAAPGSFSGNNSPCVNQNTSYAVAGIGSLNYQWSVPSNATLISGQGTSSVVIRWTTTTPGFICVRADNTSCTSDQSCYSVTPSNVPAAAGTIIKN
jgi:hypothetical protein